jgi:hypothetical protein
MGFSTNRLALMRQSRRSPICIGLQSLQKLQNGGICHDCIAIHGYQYASASRQRQAAEAYGEPSWVDPSDASARLVEEGLRRSEFAFIDFRDSSAGRQAYIQGSGLAVWEVILVVHSYKNDLQTVAKHLRWPQAKVQAAVNYAEAFSSEINEALAENEATSFTTMKRMLPRAIEFVAGRAAKR